MKNNAVHIIINPDKLIKGFDKNKDVTIRFTSTPKRISFSQLIGRGKRAVK
jgi:hypothetical protein